MAKKKNNNNKKLPWSIPLEAREDLYNGINPSADFGIGSFLSQGIGYLGGFRTGLSMNEDEARWAAYLGLPYDKEYAPDTKIRFEHDKDYPDRQYQGVSKRAKDEIREDVIPEAKRIKDEYGKEWIQVLDERGIFGNDSTIYHPRETYTGDLGKFGIREVGNSGIYEIGDKYDFPSWVPVPDRNEGTELMIRDTIWSDRANPKLYNQEVIKRKNKHDIGGFLSNIGSKLDGWNTNLTDKFLDSGIGKGLSSFGIKAGGLGGIANTAATAIGGALAGGRTTGVGNALQGIGSLASNIPGVGGLIGAGVNLIGGGVNALFGSKLNEENIATVEGDIKQALNFTSNAGNYDALASNYAGLQGVMGFDKDFIGKDSWLGKKRAKNKFNSLKEQAEEAEAHQLLALANNAQNIANTNLQLLEANYNAYGGPLNMKYTGVMSPFGNQFKDGGIYIKPSKRGTFTAAAKKRGMGVQEFASKVLANKEDYSSAMVKKANFAKNASKWKHADGGPLGEENSSNSNDKNKRTYIGGTTSDARKKYLNWDKELTQIATNLAASYGISPSLVIDRLSHEGLVDRLIKDNNEYLSHNGDPNYPSDAFDMDDYNEPYGLLGLDNIFDTYTKGITKTKRPINMIRQVNRNERGENVNSAETKNLYDTLELFVAELASRRNQVRKQYPNLTDAELDSATSARYNASNKYFKQLMDSGEYKTKYPINVKDINIPAPTKTNSKYIQDQVQSINKSDVLNAFEDYHYFCNDLIDESIFTVRNKSYNPGLFMNEENYEFDSDSPLVDIFVDNYVNRNFTIPSKVKVVDDYYEGDGKDKMYLNKKADGGNLFTNGVTFINNGDTHEKNPLEGVPMGVDSQGVPNLVEEGEVIFNDYVFSNRLRVPKEVRQKYKLRGVTFADAAKQLQKESEERPNDPISKNGLEANMQILMNEQEIIRAKKNSNRYANGGRIANKFALGDDIDIIDNPYSVYTANPTDNFNYSDWFTVDKNNLGRVTSYSDPYKNFYFTADQARAYAANNPNDESLKSYLAKGNKLEDLTDEDVQKGSLDNMHGWLHKARAKAAASEKIINPSFIPSRSSILADIDSILSKSSATPINRNIKAKVAPIQLEQEIIDELPLPTKSSDNKGIAPMKSHWLRYVPIAGAGLSVLNDFLGGNKPDYSNADLYANAIQGANRQIGYRPIGNYLRYTPFDRDFYINKLNANTGAGRRAVTNTSGGNRAAALAGILATDYNYGNQLGDLARQAEEYNLAQRQKVEEFNRATNMFNSEMGTKVDMFNAENNAKQASLYGNLAAMRQGIADRNRAEKATNLTNFIQGLGDLGRELTDRDMLRWLADLGVLKYDGKGKYTGNKKSNKTAKGGRINRKKRGGFTI